MSRRNSIAAVSALLMFVACDHNTPVESPAQTPSPVNHAPSANTGGDYGGLEGYPTTFDASRSSDQDGDSLYFKWIFEADSPPQYGITASFTYVREGTYHATLVVTDARGAADTATTTVTVQNAAPQITALTIPPAPVSLDSAAHVLASFVDLGPGDVVTADLDWGDGVKEKVNSGVVASHQYAAVGQYPVFLTVRDNQGAYATANTPNPILIYDPVVDQTNPPGYDVIDLGTLGGSGAIARALNDAGQVVGCSQKADGTWHAFVWSDGKMRDLGSGAVTSCAWAINGSGTIAGVSTANACDECTDAVVAWNSNGAPIDLGTSTCCAESVGFVAVTDGGDIVGGGTDEGHGFNSAIWQNGVKRDVPSLPQSPDHAAARALNNRRQVVGYGTIAGFMGDHINHAIITENGTTRDLGVLADANCPDEPVRSCRESYAVDINDHGVIVGISRDASNVYQGVRWTNGSLGVLGSWNPLSINEAGDIIGNAGDWGPGLVVSIMSPPAHFASGQAYFWRGGTVTRLDSFDGNATQVVAMNEASMVSGWSESSGKNPHVFVWTPGQSRLVDLGIGPRGLNQLGAVATAINGRGDVIGYTVGACQYRGTGMCWSWSGPTRAILWRRKN